MVPDRDAPTWEGDVTLNPLVLRLLECCDGRSGALFKRILRRSAVSIDWTVCVPQVSFCGWYQENNVVLLLRYDFFGT